MPGGSGGTCAAVGEPDDVAVAGLVLVEAPEALAVGVVEPPVGAAGAAV